MSLKIYIPPNNYLSNFSYNISQLSREFDIILADKNIDLMELLNNNELDLALVDPLTYANIMSETEFAVVPSKCLAIAGYSGIASIYFAKYLRKIESLAFHPNNKFFAILSSIILKEKYSFDIKAIELNDISINELKRYDTILDTNMYDNFNNSLDLTEEWFDTFEYPLPIAFWITPVHSDFDTITQITNSLYNSNKPEELINDLKKISNSYYEREGLIINNFSMEIIKSIEEIIELFFQLGIIDNIKDVRILGNDENKENIF